MATISLAEQVALIEGFLSENFAFRNNEVRDTIEFKVLNPEMGESLTNTEFMPVTDKVLNSIILEAIKAGIEGKVSDLVKRIIYSMTVESFNPLQSYLKNLPVWDGVDRVSELIKRIPDVDDEKAHFIHVWFKSLVAHWLGMDSIYGNQLVVMFIGDQGCRKGSFIKKLLPDHLQLYYLDHINLLNKHDTDMALANCGLVNLDEFDRYTNRQQATLKYIITKADVNARKIYGGNITYRPRMASFVATTNEIRPLKDKTGTRRFIVVKIPSGVILPDLPIDYDQLYAQLVNEVCEQKQVYWLSQKENSRLQILNREYCVIDDFSAMVNACFRKPENGEVGCEMTSFDILTAVQQKYPDVKIDRKSQSLLGASLSVMGIISRRTNRGNIYNVVKKAA
ncbi:MAG: VapE family protein [Prevotellaceae bacterium]|nr:VapE family protein [Prevotellaceae bacterium]